MLERLLTEARERIARDDFAGALALSSELEAGVRAALANRPPPSALKLLDQALDGLHSLIVLARAKRAHVEQEFNYIAEKRCRSRAHDPRTFYGVNGD